MIYSGLLLHFLIGVTFGVTFILRESGHGGKITCGNIFSMKLVTVLGARPQFIKAAPVSSALQQHGGVQEVVIHTGQHFDTNMSNIFFSQLRISTPDHHLDIHGGSHGRMTGRMLEAIEEILLQESPDCVMVYGDTNSTLAGALAAAKLHIPVAHVEAGLRSNDRRMPEELNRILVDNLSDLLFCPTKAAVENLESEGVGLRPATVELVGDVMLDAVKMYSPQATPPADWPDLDRYVLATFHRAENTDDPQRLAGIVEGLNDVHRQVSPVVVPLHPRTRGAIDRFGLKANFMIIEPVGYLEMLWLMRNSQLVITDSGGLQKEAYMSGKACLTLRDSTEWRELIEIGANRLVPTEREAIVENTRSNIGGQVEASDSLYGGGKASIRIVTALLNRFARATPTPSIASAP